MTAILSHINTLSLSLKKGDINTCLTTCLDTSSLDALDSTDSDTAHSIIDALKNIAQRQLALETENLRYRIVIQQQHQLLTCSNTGSTVIQDSTDNATPRNSNHGGTFNKTPTPSLSSTSPQVVSEDTSYLVENTTSENGLLSINDSPLLEKLHRMSSSFGKLNEYNLQLQQI
jgi:hypothetical protein